MTGKPLSCFGSASAQRFFSLSCAVLGRSSFGSDLKARFGPKPKFNVVPKARPRRVAESDDVYASIDPILDKISKFGIGSLTANERRQLDRERERLLKKSE